MNPALEQALLGSLENHKVGGLTFYDKMSDLMSDFEKMQKTREFESMFLQNIRKPTADLAQNPEFNQSLTGVFKKDELIMGLGAGMAGTIAGMVTRFIPINIGGLNGIPAIIGGIAGGKFLGKSGMGKDFFQGVRIAGYGVLTSGFTGNLNLGGFLGNATTASTTTGGSFGNTVF